MWKVIVAVVLGLGGYYLYTTLEEKGTIGEGSSALNKLESKKNQDFNAVEGEEDEAEE